MPHKVTVSGVYYANLLGKLLVTVKEKCRGKLTQVPILCRTMHLLTGHMLDKPLYLNVDLKKSVIHHIPLTRHRMTTIYFQF